MQDFFSFVGKGYEGEVTLDFMERIVPIILTFIVLMILIIYGKKIALWRYEAKMRKILGFFLFIVWFSYFLWRFAHGQLNAEGLPISLCSLTTIGFVAAYITNNKKVLDIVFYWGIVGGILALLFVSDVYRGVDHYRYYEFYLDHTIIFLSPFYFMFVRNYVPDIKSTIVSYVALFIAALLTLPVNLAYKMDYMIMNPYTAPSGTPAELIANFSNNNIVLYILCLLFLGTIVYLFLFILTKGLAYINKRSIDNLFS